MRDKQEDKASFAMALKVDASRRMIWTALADLIDRPTCYLVSCKIDNGSVSWGVRCTECNEQFEHVWPNEYNYCPNCGAEVIRDED